MEDWSRYEPKFRYMMLDRMRQDCDYYFGNGCRYADNLWAKDELTQIRVMKAILDTFEPEDKPEWLTMGMLMDYARRMGVKEEDI